MRIKFLYFAEMDEVFFAGTDKGYAEKKKKEPMPVHRKIYLFARNITNNEIKPKSLYCKAFRSSGYSFINLAVL
jgi:hypothetical protein